MQYNEGREDELLKKLDEIGFTEISPDVFIKKFPEFQDKIRRPIQKVWGLKMRADAWADTWVMKVDDQYSPYITHIDGKQRMWSGALFVLGFLKKISESLKEQLTEKLNKKQPAGEWIHDFVYSKNPKFAGKTKKERIQMALGAYYGAQKNEDLDTSTLFKPNDDSIEYDPDQLAAGIAIEMEHTDDEEIATVIAKHHLAEDPEYYIKLASCVEKDLQEAKIPSYSYDKVISKLKDGSWDSSYDVKKGKHLEVFDNMTKKNIIIFVEEYGAGFEGTNALRDKYIKDTPGQSIQHFKTNMKEKVYSTYQEFAAQHKKMYPSHTSDQIKAAYKKYSEYSEIEEGKFSMRQLYAVVDSTDNTVVGTASSEEAAQRIIRSAHLPPISSKNKDKLKVVKTKKVAEVGYELEEAYGESWVVYNKDTKAKISKSFKNRKAAYDYAAKNGGVVYSAEYYFDNQDDINSGKLVKEESLDEAINIRDYMATSEKSQFGGYTPKVVHKDGKTMYSGQASYNTPDEAKDHAEDYLKQYSRGISEPKVPSKGTYPTLKEEKESYDSWIIKPRDGGEPVTIKAPDKSTAIEIALGRKPSQHEIDFFNFHYILIQEKTNVTTLRNMKIVELATNCHDEKTLKEYVEQQYKSGSSVLTIKESFKKFVSNK